jgi:hypothetical protein
VNASPASEPTPKHRAAKEYRYLLYRQKSPKNKGEKGMTEAKKVAKKGYPPIGTAMYCVREHLYYVPGRAGPKTEYVVFCGEVAEHLGGNRQEFRLCGKGPEGHTELAYPMAQDIGEKVFYTAREAAELARSMTEDYERRWAWITRWGGDDIPLRRPWEHLLQEEAEE